MKPDEVYALLAFGFMAFAVVLVYWLVAWILGKSSEEGVPTR